MTKKYFGTDGIRGKFNEFPMNTSFFYNLTDAIKKTKKNLKMVLIGRDTRESGCAIEKDLVKGFNSVGVKVDKAGIISTPMLSYFTKNKNYDLGIMISASHNPYKDNGLKLCTTKRNILKTGASFFDPIGFISPIVLQVKSLFKELCKKKIDWEENRLRSGSRKIFAI